MAINKKQFKVKGGAEINDQTTFAGGVTFDSTGQLMMNGKPISGLPLPTNAQEVGNKEYIDSLQDVSIVADLSEISAPTENQTAYIAFEEKAAAIPAAGSYYSATWRSDDATIVMTNGTDKYYESTDYGLSWTEHQAPAVIDTIMATAIPTPNNSSTTYSRMIAMSSDNNSQYWNLRTSGTWYTNNDSKHAGTGKIVIKCHPELTADQSASNNSVIRGTRSDGSGGFAIYGTGGFGHGDVTLSDFPDHPYYGVHRHTLDDSRYAGGRDLYDNGANIGELSGYNSTSASRYATSDDLSGFHAITYLSEDFSTMESLAIHPDGRVVSLNSLSSSPWRGSGTVVASGIVPGNIRDMMITSEGKWVILGDNGVFTMEIPPYVDSGITYHGGPSFKAAVYAGNFPAFSVAPVPLNDWTNLVGHFGTEEFLVLNSATGEISVTTDHGLSFTEEKRIINATAVYKSGKWVQSPYNDGVLDLVGSRAMQGTLNLGDNAIVGLRDPANRSDAATKGYIDDRTDERWQFDCLVKTTAWTTLAEWIPEDNHVAYECTIFAYDTVSDRVRYSSKMLVTQNLLSKLESTFTVYAENSTYDTGGETTFTPGIEFDFMLDSWGGAGYQRIQVQAKNTTFADDRMKMVIKMDIHKKID